MPQFNGRQYTGVKGLNLKSDNGAIRFEGSTTAPTTTSGEYLLYVSSGTLYYDNGSSATALGTTSGGGSTPTWETIFGVDQTLALTTATLTISQSAAAAALTLTKSNTSTGSVLAVNNAGTGKDIYVIKTEAGASGPEIATFHNSASPATSDVVFTLNISGNSSAGTEREYGKITVTAADKTDGSEDATWNIYSMVAGTSRSCLAVTNTTATIGSGAAAAVLSSSGNYDLKLMTGNASTSYINITDGAAGAIALVPDSTGVVTISTGLQTGGTTPTACILNVAGSSGSGTTGYGAKVNATTLTTGTALLVDSASSSSGLLLDLQLATVSAFSVSETGATIIAGSAGNDVFTITAGDVVLSDTSITLTDADNAASFSATNDTATTASVFVLAGSGTFTGSTTTSFVTITPSGLTSGTGAYLPLAAITTGKGLHITSGATITQGSLLYVQTTGAAVAATSANIAKFDETATAANANRTGSTVSITSNRTVAGGTTADDFDTLSVIKATTRSSGTAVTAGSAIYAEVQTTGTVAETSNGVEVVMDSGGTGNGVKITHGATAGVALNIVSSGTDAAGIITLTANSLVDGSMLKLVGVEATLTTGLYIQCYDGAANDFSVGKYGATTIAGNASGTAALTVSAGDIVITSGFLTISANAKGVTFTGTGANGGVLKNLKNAATSALSGTQKDIEIDIGGVPYYFTVYPTKA